MKKIQFLVFLLLIGCCILSWTKKSAKKKPAQKFRITGYVMETRSYCGGARPSEEMLKRFATPAGVPTGKLFIKKGTSNSDKTPTIDSILTDEDGKFSINLPVGNYCVVEEWKTKPYKLPLNNSNQTVDSACYKKLFEACDYQLNIIDKNITDLKIVFHRPCFYNKPCINYKGPLPP